MWNAESLFIAFKTLLAGSLRLSVCALLTFVIAASAQEQAAHIPGILDANCHRAAAEKPWLDKSQTPACRALEALAAMTLEEKLAEIGGITGKSANKRLGLISGGGSDGPNGIAGGGISPTLQPRSLNVTAFPNAINLAAAWDRDLARRFGEAMGEEFAGKGMDSVLGPTINILRTWHWGRAGETFSEDPYLTAEIAVPEIAGLQKKKVLTVLKHFAGNNQENTRTGAYPNHAGIDERITDKALNEIYFPAFKAAVARSQTGAVMCSYNQINGVFSCNNPALLAQLREWGFDGFIAPDAVFAQRDPFTAVSAGLDRSTSSAIGGLIKSGRLPVSTLDRMVYRDLLPYFRLGIYDAPPSGNENANVSTEQHVRLAREIAEQSIVLLKNRDNVLPLNAGRVKSLAVIGDDAGPHATVMLTGSAHVNVAKLSTPLDAITARASKIGVSYAPGTLGIGPLPPLPENVLKPASGEGAGLRVDYYTSADVIGIPIATSVVSGVNVSGVPTEIPKPAAAAAEPGGGQNTGVRNVLWSAQWKGTLNAARDRSLSFLAYRCGHRTTLHRPPRRCLIDESRFPNDRSRCDSTNSRTSGCHRTEVLQRF
jgi:beta-glucosidase